MLKDLNGDSPWQKRSSQITYSVSSTAVSALYANKGTYVLFIIDKSSKWNILTIAKTD